MFYHVLLSSTKKALSTCDKCLQESVMLEINLVNSKAVLHILQFVQINSYWIFYLPFYLVKKCVCGTSDKKNI
jgi:hypothetical protein